ncbi:MAG: ATP-grasp domain-containing protein [Candidatus Thorarchaeota archaeon]
MKKISVLVTGVGAIIGYGIVQCLNKCKYDVNIIGIDIYDDAIGREWCDIFIKGKLTSDPLFIQFVSDIIQKNKIDLVIPGIEQDLEIFIKNLKILKDNTNAEFVLNNIDMFEILNDKLKTYRFLEEHNITNIPSIIETNIDYEKVLECFGVPFILKKRKSYASKGVVRIYDKDDYIYWKNKFDNQCIIQKLVGEKGDEFTTSIFGYGDGTFNNLIILKRELSGEGATAKAEVINDEAIEDYIAQLCKICKPLGPTNIQLIKDGGKILLLEVNPRISSSTSIREKFGLNEAEMCIEYYILKQKVKPREIKSGKARRFIEDFVEYDCNNC